MFTRTFCNNLAYYVKGEGGLSNKEEVIRSAFRTFDKDGSGYLDSDKLRFVETIFVRKFQSDKKKSVLLY
jgi:Ca2+-binding EF-hand superfamily protein